MFSFWRAFSWSSSESPLGLDTSQEMLAGVIVLIGGGHPEFQTSDPGICDRPGPLSYHLENFGALSERGL